MPENSGPLEQSQFLTFHVGSDEYAVDILQVREVLGYVPVTRMPMAPPCIRGVMNLRGQVVPVIDLPAKFGLPSSVPTRRTCIVIVEIGASSELTTMGIVVDSVDQAVDLGPADISPPPDFGTPIDVSYLRGIGKAPHGFVLVLDVDRVLSSSELSIAAALGKEATTGPQGSMTTRAGKSGTRPMNASFSARARVLAPGRVPEMSDNEYRLLAGLIHKEAGIFLGPGKKLVLVARLALRLRALGLSSFSDYVTHVTTDPAERTCMIDCVCTNETSFFREPWHFDYMARTIVPAWRNSRARSRTVRVWSAACSTGEEPYSVAMCLRHHLPIAEGWQIEILATDLSTRALKAAKQAVWPIEHAAAIPEHYRRAFMLKGEGARAGKMRAGPFLRSLISFRIQNLHAAYPTSGPFDLILCRNVLIYFEKEAKVRLVHRLTGMLAKGGHLLVGHAESLNAPEYGVRAVAPSIYVPAVAKGAP